MNATLRFVVVAVFSLLMGTVFVIWRVQSSEDSVALVATSTATTTTATVTPAVASAETQATAEPTLPPAPSATRGNNPIPPPPTPTAQATTAAPAPATAIVRASPAATVPVTATGSATPAATVAAGEIALINFQVDKTTADWADMVTISWEVAEPTSYVNLNMRSEMVSGRGEEGRLSAEVSEWWDDLPAEGSLTLNLAQYLGYGRCEMQNLTWTLSASHNSANVDGTVSTEITYNDLPLRLNTVTLSSLPGNADSNISLAWTGEGGEELIWFGNAEVYSFNGSTTHYTLQREAGASGSRAWMVSPYKPTVYFAYKYVSPNPDLPSICGTVQTTLTCPYTYWINDPTYQTPESCPTSDVVTIPAAYQPFERGVMVWDSNLHAIHVLYDDGSSTTFFRDDWTGGEVTYSQSPPAGMLLPKQGFGELWVHSEDVRSRLGWALVEEQAFSMRRQWVTQGGSNPYPYGPVYFTMPDNRVVRAMVPNTVQSADGGLNGGSWSYIN